MHLKIAYPGIRIPHELLISLALLC
jgi:hypothetical protein